MFLKGKLSFVRKPHVKFIIDKVEKTPKVRSTQISISDKEYLDILSLSTEWVKKSPFKFELRRDGASKVFDSIYNKFIQVVDYSKMTAKNPSFKTKMGGKSYLLRNSIGDQIRIMRRLNKKSGTVMDRVSYNVIPISDSYAYKFFEDYKYIYGDQEFYTIHKVANPDIFNFWSKFMDGEFYNQRKDYLPLKKLKINWKD